MTSHSKPLTPSPEPSPEMMERARKLCRWFDLDMHEAAAATMKGCGSCRRLALAFSEVAREAREAALMNASRHAQGTADQTRQWLFLELARIRAVPKPEGKP